MRSCHGEINHGVMGFGTPIHKPQIGIPQTSDVSPSFDWLRKVVELFCAFGILIPLKVLELELLNPLSRVFVVGFVVTMVVVMGNWLAVGTWWVIIVRTFPS